MKPYPIVHIELSSTDPHKTGEFLKKVFGWEVETDKASDYVLFKTGPNLGGGIPAVDNKMYQPGDSLIYMGTDDIEATLAKVKSLGGKTLVPKTEIPQMGWFAIFEDAQGCRLALYTGMPSQP
jgi:predicted enzyme related to lactoylglutathione lyase